MQTLDARPTNPFSEFPSEGIESSIPARFEQIVEKYPGRLAVKDEHLTMTYDGLNRVANRIAHTILSRLGKNEEPVALLFDHSAMLLAAILGVLKAGKIYVSIDPFFPRSRVAFTLKDSEARLLLTDDQNFSSAKEITKGSLQTVNVKEIETHALEYNPELPILPEGLAVILYTSGSTGQPKGVVHNHRNILVETRDYINYLHICPDDRLILYHTHSFANPVRTLYGALLNGASAFSYDLQKNGTGTLSQYLREEKITIYRSLVTTFRHFMNGLKENDRFPDIRFVHLGGEPMSTNDLKFYRKHFPDHCLLSHGMGPTECLTIRKIFLNKGTTLPEGKVPVGYSMPDKEVLLLDEERNPVGPNEIGEIAVRSPYLAVGYWRKPELTESVFLEDPTDPGQRIYLTGDLGSISPDGCLVHLGRKDFQVKIRGYLVDLTEVESILLGLDSVKEAIVLAREDDGDETRLVAYLTPTGSSSSTISELRQELSKLVPSYMIPSAFVMMESFPSTPSGKIDRRALPPPSQERPELDVPFEAPGSQIEKELSEIWADALDIDRVGVHDSFFDLGGDSLRASRIVNRIMSGFHTEISFQTLMESPTVSKMATFISDHLISDTSPLQLQELLEKVERASEEQM